MCTTYSCRLVVERLENIGLVKDEDFTVEACTIDVFNIYSSGVRLKIGQNTVLSIQTHPNIAGPSFAETAILHNGNVVYPEKLGYEGDVIRHWKPEDLFTHISLVLHTYSSLKI